MIGRAEVGSLCVRMRDGAWIIIWVASCGVVAATAGFAFVTYPSLAVGIAVLWLIVCLSVRSLTLLSVAAVILIPVSYLDLPDYAYLASPCAVVLVVAACRIAARGANVRRTLGAGLAVLVAWLILSAMFSASPLKSGLFGIVFVLLIWSSVLVSSSVTLQAIEGLVATLVLSVGSLGVVEFFMQSSPFAEFFASAPFPLVQHWDSYRIVTVLGHPLVNATVFSMAYGLFLFAGLYFRFTVLRIVCLGMCCVGVLLSGSRSGVVAILVVSLVAVVSVRVRASSKVVLSGLLLLMISMLSITEIGQQFLDRSVSGEAASSSDQRVEVLTAAFDVFRDVGFLGVGLGNSNDALLAYGGVYTLENSVIQLLLSTGVVGVVLVSLVFLLALRTGSVASSVGFGMMSAYVVVAASFNLFEGYPALLFLSVLPIIVAGSVAPRLTYDGVASISSAGVQGAESAV